MRHSALGVENPNVEKLNLMIWAFGHTLGSPAIDHLLDWDNHLLTIMILEYGIDWDNHWQSPSLFFWEPLATSKLDS